MAPSKGQKCLWFLQLLLRSSPSEPTQTKGGQLLPSTLKCGDTTPNPQGHGCLQHPHLPSHQSSCPGEGARQRKLVASLEDSPQGRATATSLLLAEEGAGAYRHTWKGRAENACQISALLGLQGRIPVTLCEADQNPFWD